MTKTIDMHTHVLADATVKLMQKEIPSLGLKMAPYDADNAVCEVAGVAYRPFPRGGHDIERRFKDMDAAEVDVHLLSVAPQTWLYGQEAAVGVTASAIQNDEIARHVKEHPERFSGIATLPMQAPDKAADELRRAMRKLGLHGAMIGSNIGGKNLDDPSFEPLWTAAEELDAFMMIHPGNVAGWSGITSSISSCRTAAASSRTRAAAGCTAGRCGRSRRCMSNIRRRRFSTASSTTPSCTPRRRWNFSFPRSAPIGCSSAATTLTTWAQENACGRCVRRTFPRPTATLSSAATRRRS